MTTIPQGRHDGAGAGESIQKSEKEAKNFLA
jgi:hypothetical protein